LILDRWNPHRINKKIANHHRLTINQVKTGARRPSWARIGPRGPEEDHIQ